MSRELGKVGKGEEEKDQWEHSFLDIISISQGLLFSGEKSYSPSYFRWGALLVVAAFHLLVWRLTLAQKFLRAGPSPQLPLSPLQLSASTLLAVKCNPSQSASGQAGALCNHQKVTLWDQIGSDWILREILFVQLAWHELSGEMAALRDNERIWSLWGLKLKPLHCWCFAVISFASHGPSLTTNWR